MNVIVKLPVEIPEKTLNELAKRAAEEMVKNDPDIVSVVRCKDCRFFHYSRHNFCHFFGGMEEDDYCSRGVKKECETE